jgi:hypothetical protein
MNADYAIHLLRRRADERAAAAERTPPRHHEFAEHCRAEARFFDGVADCIEQFQREAAEERTSRVLEKAGAGGVPRPLPAILKELL